MECKHPKKLAISQSIQCLTFHCICWSKWSVQNWNILRHDNYLYFRALEKLSLTEPAYGVPCNIWHFFVLFKMFTRFASSISISGGKLKIMKNHKKTENENIGAFFHLGWSFFDILKTFKVKRFFLIKILMLLFLSSIRNWEGEIFTEIFHWNVFWFFWEINRLFLD